MTDSCRKRRPDSSNTNPSSRRPDGSQHQRVVQGPRHQKLDHRGRPAARFFRIGDFSETLDQIVAHVTSLREHGLPAPERPMDDQQLWRSCRDRVEIRASLTILHASQDSGDVYSAVLRITKNNELIVREVFCDERTLHAQHRAI
jgi:hypothetical protein